MSGNKQTKYSRQGNKLLVEREFDALPDEVWQAWTKSDLLDQWWAPLPWKAQTKSMDFRNGGAWLYCMVGPEGERNWCRMDFETIETGKFYKATDAFCDENGNLNSELPSMHWKTEFLKTATGTKVMVEVSFDSEADLETIVSMGFREGFSMAHGNLDQLLAKQLQQ